MLYRVLKAMGSTFSISFRSMQLERVSVPMKVLLTTSIHHCSDVISPDIDPKHGCDLDLQTDQM